MALTYGSSVEIDGNTIDPTWGIAALVALDDFTITWGRQTIYEETPPSTAKLSIIDTAGTWGTDSNLGGKRVIIRRTNPDKIVFRGAITGIEMSPVVVTDPDSGAKHNVWRVDLTAVDPLGEAGQTVVDGPGDPVSGDTQGWPADRAPGSGRMGAVWSAGANKIFSSAAEWAAGDYEFAFVRARLREDGFSILDLIRECYRHVVVGHVNYRPDLNQIGPGKTAAAAGIRLTLSGGKIITTPTNGFTIPASQLEIDRRATLRAPVESAIDVVQMSRAQRSIEDPERFVQGWETRTTTRYNPARTAQRALKVEADVNTAPNPSVNIYVDMLAKVGRMAAVVSQLNERFYMPPVRFDFRRFDPPAEVADVLLSAFTTTQPFQFPGSKFNGLPNVGPSFQIIGGQIGYRRGWWVSPVLAPTAGAINTITLGQLSSNATATLDQFSDSITLGELGLVTQGLA